MKMTKIQRKIKQIMKRKNIIRKGKSEMRDMKEKNIEKEKI